MIEIFAPVLMTHLIYSVLCFAVFVAVVAAVDTLRRIRRRHRYLRFRLRYAMQFARTIVSAN